jgi:glucose/arabinose dehydrogenase
VIRRLTPLLLSGLLLAACGDDGGGGAADESGSAVIVTTTTNPITNDTSAGTDRPTATAPPPTASTATDVAAATTPASAPPPTSAPPQVGDPRVASVEVGRFDQPVDLVARPGDDALYIVEQPGRVVRFDGTEQTVIADVRERVNSGGERGLLGLEFSSDGELAYLNYTDRNGDTVVAEFPVDGTFDTDAERILLTVDQPYRNHNGGDLQRGPDGTLYIALGDGGSANDPQRRAGDPTSLLGSLLRIDPTPSADAPYTIPADNPFATGSFDGVAGAPEVWAWGLRNPWKIEIDPVTDELWIADVGQNQFEEIDRVGPTDGFPAGRGDNFGWSAFEGTERFNTDVADVGPVPPVLTYRHGDDGCSISGGVPYRGAAIAELEPAYVYSDYCSGKVWALDLAGGRNLTLLEGFSSVTAVRAGPDAELYVLEAGGTLHRLVPG